MALPVYEVKVFISNVMVERALGFRAFQHNFIKLTEKHEINKNLANHPSAFFLENQDLAQSGYLLRFRPSGYC